MLKKNRFVVQSMLLPILGLIILFFVLTLNFPSQAAYIVYTVNTTADIDDGSCDATNCSLREAILAANNSPGADKIGFSLLPNTTITLSGSQLPTITDILTIDGDTATNLTVSGNNLSRVFRIGSGTAVTLTSLTIADGARGCNNCLPAHGGGIYNGSSNLTIIDSIFLNNSVFYFSNGGGIYNDGGQVLVRNSTFKNNYAISYSLGGAIYNNSGELEIEDSKFFANLAIGAGGGIVNNITGTLTIKNSDFISNSASFDFGISPFGGGALNNQGRAEVINTKFDSNRVPSSKGNAGGAIVNSGYLTVSNSILSENFAAGSGGAIYNNFGSLWIIGCEISNNSVSGPWSGGKGGGLNNNWGSSTIVNSTIRNNFATRMPVLPIIYNNSGGGIANSGFLNIFGSTINDNTVVGLEDDVVNGGGIANENSGVLKINNSTVSGNSAVTPEDGLANGGGLYNTSVLTMTHSTFSDNSAVVQGNGTSNGGGIDNSGSMSLYNTIIANSLDGGDCVNSGTIFANTNNLVEDGSCSPSFIGDPLLSPLQSNGGQTLIHSPLMGSLAIDNGDNASCLEKDQRGISRPIDGDDNGTAVCDIGSVEVGGKFIYLPVFYKMPN